MDVAWCAWLVIEPVLGNSGCLDGEDDDILPLKCALVDLCAKNLEHVTVLFNAGHLRHWPTTDCIYGLLAAADLTRPYVVHDARARASGPSRCEHRHRCARGSPRSAKNVDRAAADPRHTSSRPPSPTCSSAALGKNGDPTHCSLWTRSKNPRFCFSRKRGNAGEVTLSGMNHQTNNDYVARPVANSR